MNAISRCGVWSVLLGSVTAGVASAQTVGFPIPGNGAPEISISVAWDGARFLAGLQGNSTPNAAVLARFIEPTGQSGPLVTLSNNGTSPRVAFGGGDYLVVWGDLGTWPNNDIYGMFVQPDGSHAGAFPICVDATPKDVTGIAYAGGTFLVPYTRGTALLARRVTLAGVVGPELALTNSYYSGPSATNVGTDGSSYLVAWADDASRHEVKACLVPTVGAPGPEFTVDASAAASNDVLTVAGTAAGYLVAYTDEVGGPGSGEWDLFTQAISAGGFPVGAQQRISDAPGQQWAPFLATDGADYVITWTDARWDFDRDAQCDPGERTCWDVYGRYLAFDGTPLGPEWPIIEHSGDQFVSPMAFGPGHYLMAWTAGSLQQDGGLVYGLFMPQFPFASLYCVAKVNSLGCVPDMRFSGVPSASSPDGFTVSASDVRNNASGTFFYGLSGRNNAPFMGGTLCTLPPVRRTGLQFSGGNPPPDDCSGAYALDFNAWMNQGFDPRLAAGQVVRGQYWSRDPQSTFHVGLTGAVEFVIGP